MDGSTGRRTADFKAIAAALKQAQVRGLAAIELAFPPHYTPVRPLKEDWKIGPRIRGNDIRLVKIAGGQSQPAPK